jgi:hypothetical protein
MLISVKLVAVMNELLMSIAGPFTSPTTPSLMVLIGEVRQCGLVLPTLPCAMGASRSNDGLIFSLFNLKRRFLSLKRVVVQISGLIGLPPSCHSFKLFLASLLR